MANIRPQSGNAFWASVAPLFRRRLLAAWGVLIASLAMVVLAAGVIRNQEQLSAERQFQLYVDEVSSLITQRMRDHEQILLGGGALFKASNEVRRDEWRTYIESLNLNKNYPGILGVGYSVVIPRHQLAQHIATIRAEGFPNYVVKPQGDREIYSAIVYLEPFLGRNLAAFGYDMMSEETRAAAMRQAASSAETALSGKVTLVQETHGKVQSGFLMYVPIYAKGVIPETEQARWRALQGFVYSPYRIDDLMAGILGPRRLQISFRIYDNNTISDETLMFETEENDFHTGLQEIEDAPPPRYTASRTLTFYQHDWTVVFENTPAFEADAITHLDKLVVGLGGVVSLLLTLLVWFLSFRREQALELAKRMTQTIRDNETRLRQSEERYQLAVRGSNDGIWDWNLETGHMYYAPRFQALLGYEEGSFSNTFTEFEQKIHPQDKNPVLQAIKAHLESESPYDIMHRLLTRSGEWRWFRSRGAAIRNKENVAIRMAGSISDIHQQKMAEAEAEEHAQHTQAILNNINDGIITVDEIGFIASFNRAAERIFHYNADSVIGYNLKRLFANYSDDDASETMSDYLSASIRSDASGEEHEIEGVRQNGERFPVGISVSEVHRRSERLFIVVVRDITERKRVDRMKNEFISTVSHELRTPLTSITGALSLLLNGAVGQPTEEFARFLQIAYKNSQRLALLINDLLDMEKITAGGVKYSFSVEPVMPLVEQSIDTNLVYGQQHEVEYQITHREDGSLVNVDPLRFQQILANFLSNAAKFSPQGSTVNISVQRRENYVRISVTDRGPGIPPEFYTRIFKKFSQADSSDRRQKGGTGLGLFISRELAKGMHGRIDFESEVGKGATFYVELPLASGSVQGAIAPEPEEA
ncbi:CHASE domain-containing protein [Hahella sp. CR1]|uniref:CHASE domain-containing protein n=1 Tax=Hahella sp. CR1 TaxID=2992807 RepID=UPI0024425F9F|nr:CHASE domain-containing protein [Hahella sp. CR1]MDG9668004.1 CHASE domain-containing protein [Hahella sp. CR1]